MVSVLDGLTVPHALVAREVELMGEHQLARTVNRSVVGLMNEFPTLLTLTGGQTRPPACSACPSLWQAPPADRSAPAQSSPIRRFPRCSVQNPARE